MKFFVIDYTYEKVTKNGIEERYAHRLFDFDNGQHDSENFCKQVKENGGAVNIRVRDIDPKLFD